MKLLVLFLFYYILTISCTKPENAKTPLQTTRDKFSYALGYDFGPNMKHIKSGVELQMFMRGLEDYLNEKQSLVPLEERQRLRAEEFTRIGDEYMAHKKEQEQKNLQDGENFLAENKTKPGVITTTTGLQYLILSDGAGPRPTPDDRLKVKYRGTFIDGKEFVNTETLLDKSSTFLLRSAIAGWAEGIQLMRVGSKYRFFLHPNLAFGKIGQEAPAIPPNATLIYDVELLEIMTE
jgi:FKBP-type peptidyl-prolyl cis-trans isomerase